MPAEQKFGNLYFERGDLTEALMKLSVPLPLSAVVLNARSYDVGYEAAAIVALKHEGRWPHITNFTLHAVLAEVAGEMANLGCLTCWPVSRQAAAGRAAAHALTSQQPPSLDSPLPACCTGATQTGGMQAPPQTAGRRQEQASGSSQGQT